MQSDPFRRAAAVALALSLLADARWVAALSPQSTVDWSAGVFDQQALSAPALSATRLDRLMSALDRTFEHLFGNFAGTPYGPLVATGEVPVVWHGSMSVAEEPPGGGSVLPESAGPPPLSLSEAEALAERLAWDVMRLHDDVNQARDAAALLSFLERLAALRAEAQVLIPAPVSANAAPTGRSRDLGRLIERKSKGFREATRGRDERKLDSLNLEARALLAERIELQLASAERELRRNHRPIVLSSLFGAAKSLWRLRLEYFWASVRLFRRVNLGDFLSLDGIAQLEGYLTPGSWPGGPIRRKETRMVLVDREKGIREGRKVDVEYKDLPTFLKGQYAVLAKEFRDAVEILYEMAYLRYIQLHLEFHPTVLDLKKSRRDAIRVRAWAAKGTGKIRAGIARLLEDADSSLQEAISLRGKPEQRALFQPALARARRLVQAARRDLLRRLPAIKSIRRDLMVKVQDLINPYLRTDEGGTPASSQKITGRGSA